MVCLHIMLAMSFYEWLLMRYLLCRATIMQMQGSRVGQADTGSVALPAVLRAGETGPAQFSVGNVQPAKFSTTSHQAHKGHMVSTVSVLIVFS